MAQATRNERAALDHEVSEMVLADDEDVVEELAAESANEAFGNAFMSGARGAVRGTRVPTASAGVWIESAGASFIARCEQNAWRRM